MANAAYDIERYWWRRRGAHPIQSAAARLAQWLFVALVSLCMLAVVASTAVYLSIRYYLALLDLTSPPIAASLSAATAVAIALVAIGAKRANLRSLLAALHARVPMT
jgi:hypothetical protein